MVEQPYLIMKRQWKIGVRQWKRIIQIRQTTFFGNKRHKKSPKSGAFLN
jgi:hypothetical protein